MSEHDRRAHECQVRALAGAEQIDEGTVEWRAQVTTWLDEQRRRIGIGPLKTEGELHRRARALGHFDEFRELLSDLGAAPVVIGALAAGRYRIDPRLTVDASLTGS